MKTLITGAGLLGTAAHRHLPDSTFPHGFWDLTQWKKAKLMMETYRPEVVVHTAAKVGGVRLNSKHQEEMFYDNVSISANVIHAAAQGGVSKVIAFGSTCAFDEKVTKLDEANVQFGSPYRSNLAYGYAKRMTEIHLWAAHEQYKLKYVYFIPVSMFGAGDSFSLQDGHVIPSLIHKCYLAKEKNEPLRVWGSGDVKREVLYADDMARVIAGIPDDYVGNLLVSSGTEVSVGEMVSEIVSAMNFNGDVVWEGDKPEGQKKRPLVDRTQFCSVFQDFRFTPFAEAIRKTVDWFVANYPNVRK